MQKVLVLLMVYMAILTYLGYATLLTATGESSLPLSLAEKGDFMSLWRASMLLIIFVGIGLGANYYLLHRRWRQNQKASQSP